MKIKTIFLAIFAVFTFWIADVLNVELEDIPENNG